MIRPNTAAPRQTGVDLGRVLGCFFVILLHQSAQDYGPAGLVSDIIDQIARWAVPFFFVMAGYFSRFETGTYATIQRIISRVLPLYLVWFALYLALADPNLIRLDNPLWLTAALIYGGPGFHLWFLPSLIICVAFATLILNLSSFRVLCVIAGGFYLAGLALGSYETAVSSPGFIEQTAPLNSRSGPFFGLVFVTIGVWMKRTPAAVSLRGAALICVAGIALSNLEAIGLLAANNVPYIRHDFLFGTLLLGYGSAALFTQVKIPGGTVERVIQTLGPVSFGIYAVHIMVLRSITDWVEPRSLLEGIGVAVVVFALSAAISVAGSKVPGLKRIFA